MSNEFAIAAVTLTLRNLLNQIQLIKDSDEFDELPEDAKPTAEILVTNLSLDKAHEFDEAKNQVNLFLYHVAYNPAWRNMDIPSQVKPGETGHPPLALNLYYVITTYGQNNNELIGHLLLGKAMSLLHDYGVFGRNEIKYALAVSGLHEQVERVRITPQPISLDEVSKLWTGFQTQYRLSVAYEVSVVLIESKRPAKAPLPVLTRGPGDQGAVSQPDLIPPFPTLKGVQPPNDQPAVRLGEVLTLTGHHLDGDSVVVYFMNPHLTEAIEASPLPGGTAAEIKVELPNEPTNWPAGSYALNAVISRVGEQDRTTNNLPFVLAPRILGTTLDPPPPSLADNCGLMAIVNCSPQIRPEQSVALLLGDREIPAQPHSTQTDTLAFCLMKGIPSGDYFIRLRVDGADSLLVDRSVTPPVFDESQKVTIA